jgi:fructose-1,6-bisphosphatase
MAFAYPYNAHMESEIISIIQAGGVIAYPTEKAVSPGELALFASNDPGSIVR